MSKTITPNPVGNTGLKLQDWTIGADYLNLTTRLPDEESVRKCFADVAYQFNEDGGLVFTEDKGLHKGKYYAHTANTPHGIKMAWNVRLDTGVDVWVSIPGAALARVDGRMHLGIFKRLKSSYNFEPTRFDIALDDYLKKMSPDFIMQAIRDKNYVGFGKSSVITNQSKSVEGLDGWTIYMGSRKSDKMYRYYDKNAESKGQINAFRLEAELKDFKAKQVWDLITQIPENDANALQFYQSILLEVVIGGIDFRNLSADSNKTRCPKLEWWQEFIDYVHSTGGIKLTGIRSKSSLQKTVSWVKNQVETSLAMLRDVLGSQQFHGFIRDAIDSGRLRYTRQHEAIIKLHIWGYDELQVTT